MAERCSDPNSGECRNGAARLLPRAGAVVLLCAAYAFALAWDLAQGAVHRNARSRPEVVGKWLAALLERLGSTYVKVGQILSVRSDLLHPGITRSLRVLQDQLEPVPASQIVATLEASLGAPLNHVFEFFDPSPVATASVAQVHRARLADTGVTVAVKVRRPGIHATMRRDLALLSAASRVLGRWRRLRRIPVEQATAQVVAAVDRQLDFRKEAEANRRIRGGLIGHQGVLVPRLFERWCREDVLVMEFIEPLHRLDDEGVDPRICRTAILNGLRALYAMIFRIGMVHCDLHPGNMFAHREGVVILDTGFVADLTNANRSSFRDFFMAIVFRDGRQAARVLRETADWVDPEFCPARFRADVEALIHRTSRKKVGEFQVVAFVAELFDILRRHGVHGAPGFTLTILSLLVFEGSAKFGFPDLDFQREAVPYAGLALIEAAAVS